MKKMKRFLSRLMSFALVLSCIVTGMASAEIINGGGVVHAASANLKVGTSVKYGSWSTHYFSVNNGTNNAYCAEPSKSTPSAGTYEAEDITNRHVIMTGVVFCSLYAPGHLYGMKGSNGKDVNSIYLENGCSSAADIYITSHLVISYVYASLFQADGISTAWTKGISDAERARIVKITETIQTKYLNGQGTINWEGFKVFRIKNNSQDIIYWEYQTPPPDEEEEGEGSLRKVSANPELTKKNTSYSLAGAEYKVYKDRDCTDYVGTLKTGSNGYTNSLTLEEGTYYIIETKASPGYKLDPDYVPRNQGGSGPQSFYVAEGESVSIKSKEPPLNDPIWLLLKKADADTGEPYAQGDAVLEGAEYTVRFYGDLEAGDHSGKVPLRTWIFRTDSDGLIKYSYDCLVGGDPLFTDEYDNPVLPLGTTTIVETSAPEGYLINPEIYVCQTIQQNMGVVTLNLPTEQTKAKEQVMRGGVRIAKVDSELESYYKNPGGSQGKVQGDATLEGVVFEIINKSDAAVVVDGRTYNPGSVVKEITTRHTNGMYLAETATNCLPYGTYRIREKSTSTGYRLGRWFDKSAYTYSEEDGQPGYNFEIRANGDMVDYSDKPVSNPPIRGGFTINKVDVEYWLDKGMASQPQGDAELSGAIFEVVNRSNFAVLVPKPGVDKEPIGVYSEGAANKVMDGYNLFEPGDVMMELTTDERGFVTTDTDGNGIDYSLPYGTYEVREKTEPVGYLHDGHSGHNPGNRLSVTFSVREHGKVVSLSSTPIENPVIRGGIEIQKWDAEFDIAEKKQGDATLGGAVFAIINESKNPVKVDGNYYNPGEVVKEITTDESGYTKTDDHCLPYGSYRIKEVKAPEGYLNEIVDNYGVLERTFKIREEDEGRIINLTLEDERYEGEDFGPIKNEVIRGGVRIVKKDIETKISEAIGGKDHTETEIRGATLEGIEFTIWNISDNFPTYGNSILYPYNPVQEEIIKGEVTKREGGNPNTTWAEVMSAPESGYVDTLTMKWNEELKEYSCETGPRDLPYGTYLIAETKSNDSYILSDRSAWTFEIREDGVIVTDYIKKNGGIKDAITSEKDGVITEIINGEPVEFERDTSITAYDRVRRNDIEFEKIADTISKRMQVAFAIKNESTGETHVLVTNENGEAATHIDMGDYENTTDIRDVKFPPHSWDTNANDKLLLNYGEEGGYGENNPIPTSEINTKAGIWFGLTEGKAGDASDGVMAPVNDNLCALPFGLYTLKELRCEDNVGYVLQEFTFRIYQNKADTHTFGVDISTVTDDLEPVPSIRTIARDKETKKHVAVTDSIATIVDKVLCDNLTPGKEYRVSGVLMDKFTASPVKDKDGKDITSELKFVPKEAKGYVELEFTVDATQVYGKPIVVFEKLFLGEDEVASHEDIDDENQEIEYDEPSKPEEPKPDEPEPEKPKPSIGTKAHDKDSGLNVGVAREDAIIVDTVSYKNLIPGNEYKMIGTLMDKATGKELLDKDGKAIVAERTFKPKESDGTVALEFKLNAKELGGKSVVVFEKLYLNEEVIATHMDLNDEGQTVTYEEPEKIPAIGTKARDKDSGNNEGLARENAVIIDTVEYKNLKPGKEYKMVGILMDKETKKPLLDKDGKSITSSLVFKPEKEDGSVELEFVFNAKDLGGKSVVVFEKLFLEDKEIANHEDIEDAGQTVTYTEPKKPDEPEKPDIPTTPKTGDDSVSLPLLILLAFALGALLGTIRYTVNRRRDREDEEDDK